MSSAWRGTIPRGGYTRIQGALKSVGHRVSRWTIARSSDSGSSLKVGTAGVQPAPRRPQLVTTLTGTGFIRERFENPVQERENYPGARVRVSPPTANGLRPGDRSSSCLVMPCHQGSPLGRHSIPPVSAGSGCCAKVSRQESSSSRTWTAVSPVFRVTTTDRVRDEFPGVETRAHHSPVILDDHRVSSIRRAHGRTPVFRPPPRTRQAGPG